MTIKLFEHQREGACWLTERRCAILADDMGTGKTLTALAAMLNLGLFTGTIIVAPNRIVQHKWVAEIKRFREETNVEVLEAKQPKIFFENPHVVVTTYSALTGWRKKKIESMAARGIPAIIFDESHYLKNHTTQRTKFWKSIARSARIRWMLTATPITRDMSDLASQLHAVHHPQAHRITNNIKWRWDGYRNVAYDWIDHDLTATFSRQNILRRRLDDVIDDMPGLERQIVRVPVQKGALRNAFFETASSYDIADFKISRILESFDDDAVYSAESRVWQMAIAAACYAAARAKAGAIRPWLDDLVTATQADGGAIIVFGRHKKPLRDLAEALAKSSTTAKIGHLSGDVRPDERQEAIEKLNTGEIDVLFATYDTAGVGVDLTGADRVVFLEVDFDYAKMVQAAARIHRIGQKKKGIIYTAVCEDEGLDPIARIENILVRSIDTKRRRAESLEKEGSGIMEVLL